MRACPTCGSDENPVTVDHGPDWEAEGYGARRHNVCPACDRGLCSADC